MPNVEDSVLRQGSIDGRTIIEGNHYYYYYYYYYTIFTITTIIITIANINNTGNTKISIYSFHKNVNRANEKLNINFWKGELVTCTEIGKSARGVLKL